MLWPMTVADPRLASSGKIICAICINDVASLINVCPRQFCLLRDGWQLDDVAFPLHLYCRSTVVPAGLAHS